MTDIWLIARKDLKIEMRSRVLINQVAPFALIILVLFGIATVGLLGFGIQFIFASIPLTR